MADPIEVIPQKNGKWRVSGESGSYESRTEAIAVAREAAGATDLFDADGNRRGQTDVQVPVVLLRLDGSVYGELYAPTSGSAGQRVTLTPAAETGDAGMEG